MKSTKKATGCLHHKTPKIKQVKSKFKIKEKNTEVKIKSKDSENLEEIADEETSFVSTGTGRVVAPSLKTGTIQSPQVTEIPLQQSRRMSSTELARLYENEKRVIYGPSTDSSSGRRKYDATLQTSQNTQQMPTNVLSRGDAIQRQEIKRDDFDDSQMKKYEEKKRPKYDWE